MLYESVADHFVSCHGLRRAVNNQISGRSCSNIKAFDASCGGINAQSRLALNAGARSVQRDRPVTCSDEE